MPLVDALSRCNTAVQSYDFHALFRFILVCHVKRTSSTHALRLNLSLLQVIVYSVQHLFDMAALDFEIYIPTNTACSKTERQSNIVYLIICYIAHIRSRMNLLLNQLQGYRNMCGKYCQKMSFKSQAATEING
jgi:hypothetical protein